MVVSQTVRGGAVRSAALLRGRFVIPLVAYDGSAGGIAPDGRTLVVIRPRASFPRAATTFAVFDHQAAPAAAPPVHAARRLQLRRALARRPRAVSHQLPVRARPDALPRAGLRPRAPAPRPEADRRPARTARRDERPADDARHEPGRALGVHALRRRRQAPVHPCARHERAPRGLHRPARPRVRANPAELRLRLAGRAGGSMSCARAAPRSPPSTGGPSMSAPSQRPLQRRTRAARRPWPRRWPPSRRCSC